MFCTLPSRCIREHSAALDTGQWSFYVAHTGALDEKFDAQKTATLASLQKRLGKCLKQCSYSSLAQEIHEVALNTRLPAQP